MKRRNGATLIEVLVAIFVMALGMLALLTLFPLGALRMASAIQDDRTTQSVVNAASIASVKDLRHENYDLEFRTGGGVFKPANPEGPSYPVLVDPAGYLTNIPGDNRDWAAGFYVKGAIPRRTVAFAPNNTETLRWFSLLDEMDFDQNGIPPPTLNRDLRFSWAYLLQRPRTSDPSIVTCNVVVFNGRPLSLTNNLTLPEFGYTNSQFDTSRNLVTINWAAGQEPPPLRPGSWILDASYVEDANYHYQHAYFYRVVGVNDTGPNSMEVEVQTPFRGFNNRFGPGPVYNGIVIVLEGVAEVFERGPGWQP